MLVFAGVLVVCIASVNSVGICEGLFGVQWKMDPVDCSKFYWCMNGREYEFKCPADSVVNQESRSIKIDEVSEIAQNGNKTTTFRIKRLQSKAI